MSSSVQPNTRKVGAVVVLLALWGGLIPFVGPLFDFDMGTESAWTWTESRASLHVIPAIVAALGGLLLLLAAGSAIRWLGSVLTVGAGAWFIIGPSLRPLWVSSEPQGKGGMSGMTHSTTASVSPTRQALESLGYHYGIGALILAVAAGTVGMLAAYAIQARAAERAAPRWEPVPVGARPAAFDA